MLEICINCISFDAEKHKNDCRTAHAGICLKWQEVTFISDTCKQFFSLSNSSEKIVFSDSPLKETIFIPNQLSLF